MNENNQRNYPNSKVYNDGSHYIAIPQGSYPSGKGCKKTHKPPPTPEQTERKQAFETAYKDSKKVPYKQRDKYLDEHLKDAIPDGTERKKFIAENKDRKKRNLSKRYSLLWRKVRLQRWNWFCTFTYDSAKCSEEEFKSKLKDTLKKLVMRKGWKYLGVWEHGGENKRLHFHRIFVIPENGMVGELQTVSDYSTKKHRRQTKIQNIYFLKRFGLNEFEEIVKPEVEASVKYLIKYLDKDGGRNCQGGDIKPYFRSNVLGEDIVTPYDEEGRKFILFDDFTCIDEDGVVHGKVQSGCNRQNAKKQLNKLFCLSGGERKRKRTFPQG